MKFLKLLGILLLFVAGLIGIIYLPDLFKGSAEFEFAQSDKINVNAIRDEFISQWDAATMWDATLHQKQHEKVLRLRNNKMLSKPGYEALTNIIRESAINKVCGRYNEVLKSTPFNHGKLQAAYSDVPKVKKAEGLDTLQVTDHRISHIEKLHKFYREAKAFAESRHQLTPDLNTTSMTWTSFNQQKQNRVDRAKRYRTNTLYPEISHISLIANGLKEDEVVKRAESHRNTFYQELYNDITTHFADQEQSNENLLQIRRIRTGAFAQEAPSTYRNMLLDYELDYEDRLNE